MRNRFLAIVGIILVWQPLASGAIEYSFSKIIDSTGAFAQFSAPAMNNDGTLSFIGMRDDDSAGVFVQQPGSAPQAIAENAGYFEKFSPGRLQINDARRVLFGGFYTEFDFGLYAGGVGQSVETLAEVGAPPRMANFGLSVDMNNAGITVFDARHDLTVDNSIYIHHPGGAPAIHIDNDGIFSRTSWPRINDGGQVAFTGVLDSGESGVFRRETDGSYTTIVVGEEGLGAAWDISESGLVAIKRYGPDGARALYTGTGGALSLLANDTGLFDDFWDLDINSAGQIMYCARFDGQVVDGIFNGPDPVADRVIGPGDALFGSAVWTVFFRDALSNSGDFAFVYILDNGETGIAVAHVPESGTALTLGLCGIFLVRKKIR